MAHAIRHPGSLEIGWIPTFARMKSMFRRGRIEGFALPSGCNDQPIACHYQRPFFKDFFDFSKPGGVGRLGVRLRFIEKAAGVLPRANRSRIEGRFFEDEIFDALHVLGDALVGHFVQHALDLFAIEAGDDPLQRGFDLVLAHLRFRDG